MSIAAFILARKGSKRLPGKNTKLLCGKPLICWTIDSAIESTQFMNNKKVFDTIVIGTNDIEVKKICKKYKKIKIIDLPGYLTSDNAPQTEALLYCMDKIEKHDYIVLLQPTSPLRNNEDYEQMALFKFDYSISENSKYEDKSNGAFYMAKWDIFYTNRKFFTGMQGDKYSMPPERSIDIDTAFDFKIAEMLMKERLNK